ncbi:MAG: hypothetical protein IJ602_00240 [Paludibacteraceae bacterium]|nr:hypothetical protein [Paludibacteraceae bacterium]
MTKKSFLSIAMVFLGLLAGTNTAWANLSDLPNEAKEALKNPIYKAKLTGKTSSTGGGKVYITNLDSEPKDYSSFTEGTSNVSTSGLAVTMQGMEVAQVPFWCWAKAEDGYYFAGYSFSNGGVDLDGGEHQDSDAYKYVRKFDTSAEEGGTEEYSIYGTFEPIRISAYSLSGDNTMSGDAPTCTQIVTFTFSGNDIDQSDFNAAEVTEIKNGGTWSSADGNAWTPSDLTIEGNSATLVVMFTAPNANAAEYSATLRLVTKANIAINVPLNARKTATGAEALLYDGKTQKEAGITTLDGLLAVDIRGYKKPIIKLNGNYTDEVTIGKDITFDLNGFTLSNTLKVSGGNVTIAYSPYGGSANALSVTGGKAILNGGTFGTLNIGINGTVEQNGATFTGAATNSGTLITTDGVFQAGLLSSGTLTVNGGEFKGNVAVDITGGTALVKKGLISGDTYGIRSAGTTTTIEKLAVVSGGAYALKKEAGTLTVNNGKFVDPANFAEGSIAFNSGYFQTNNSDMQTVSGKQIWRNTAGAEYRERYEYFAGDYAQAKAAGVSICRIGATSYSSLEDALAYANNTTEKVTIIMLNDYTLPAGHYTLPANATLIVPMSAEQGSETQMVEHEKSYNIPSCYRKLIFSNGVNMNVHGTIEISGKQLTSDGNFTGSPSGPHGLLQLNQGSKMVLQNNSLLRVWGFVTGDVDNKDAEYNVPSGEIDARRGSTVRELFQMGDWKGGAFSGTGLIAGDSIFPLTTYFIQNVEAPVKYHPGSSLVASTTVSALNAITMSANDIQIIGKTGDVAMFLMDEMADAENTWVRKWYDASKDQQVYEINSGAHIGSLVIPLVSSPLLPQVSNLPISNNGSTIGEILQGLTGAQEPVQLPENLIMNSGQYFLPITMNFKLHLLSGEMDFTQSTELLPGSEVEVDKEAKVLISAEDPKDDVKGGSLFIYDIRDWGNYADGEPTRLLQYSPVFGGAPTTRQPLKSASVNVHGAFDTRGGYVYTTAHGANIYSSVEDAGTFMFTLAAKSADYTEKINQMEGRSTRKEAICYSAWLNNHPELDEPAESDYVKTGGNAEAGDSYCYIDIDGTGGKWTKLKMEGCFVHDEASGIYYAKPQEYVALANGKTADPETHTYSDAAGNLYILMTENCQWWAVEKKDNLYHCTHPENDTYYYWDEAEEQWKEKTFVITWQNYDGTPIKSYKYDVSEGEDVEVEYRVTYGTMAEYNGSNPTRPADVDYTYDFTGWSPELGKVTSDVTYTATYEKKQIKYTVTFVEDGGMEIEKHLLARDEMPVCENAPTRTGYILQWEPGLGPVVGEQTYTATWLPEPPSTHVITFKNYDGTTLEVQNEAPAGETPVYGGAEPEKLATGEYSYTFIGWKPTLAPATTNAIYVAQYSENPVEYTIDFYDENQTKILKSESLPYGATPTPPVVSKEDPAANTTYTMVWKNRLDANKTIQTVTEDASYYPYFSGEENRYTRYTVTLSANIPAGVTLIGAGTYDEGESVTIQAIPADGYEFVKWSDNKTGADYGEVTITEDLILSAEVRATAVAEDLEITATGSVTLNAPATKHDLVITSDGATSGELIGANYLTLTGDAYFDLAINAQAETWYAVAVPWQVSVADGIFVNGVKQSVNSNFYLLTYNSEDRATNGASSSNWTFENNTCIMQPGTLYMIYMVNGADVIRFKKKDGQILTTSLNVYAHSSANVIDAGWNGIANPALYHAYLNAQAETYGTANFGQKYKPVDDSYDPIDMKNNKLIVGQPVFVQVKDPKTVVAEANNTGFGAPRRRVAPVVDNAYYEVQISAGESCTDRIYLQTLEDKEDTYVIGLDLAKAGVSNKVAQMWVNRYNAKLCVNTTAPVGKTATYPLGISVPENGTYQISSATEMQNNQELYVTRNGNAIWNLAYGPYTVTLDKGTYAEYGIKLIQSNAPAVTTGVDQTQTTNDKLQIQKVIIDNQVYIVRDGALYTITGQKVE